MSLFNIATLDPTYPGYDSPSILTQDEKQEVLSPITVDDELQPEQKAETCSHKKVRVRWKLLSSGKSSMKKTKTTKKKMTKKQHQSIRYREEDQEKIMYF